ncbi:TrkH family potassium uptake protein [Ornithinibacillus halophilus]|uniref:Trk-type K+ transport system, membrane component n=1 Tax=Ornithinibacillus halophilus TaxID=930117 RepID=A0A1M5I906_9BACI|nr:TrkH family potassium uptake protein [Ornithinibacillus halophilus]SHG24732.1 Trk-type K+ transport system, membrane component [Ornithinibacillus halophilus]
MDFTKSFNRWFNHLSPVRMILFFYMLAVIVSTLLLSMPIAHKDGINLPLIDVLFVAVSALSVTGLTPITIVDSFSVVGFIIIAAILQLGAVGVMAIGTFIWILIGKKIGLKERRLIMTDQNMTNFEGMVRLIKQIIIVLVIIEFVGFITLGTYFLQYYPTVKEAYLHGFFGTISAITNGGFDITGESLMPFRNDYFVQFINILLIIFGAIGFPVLIEVKNFLFSKYDKRRTIRFSLFTKVTTSTFLILIVIGSIFIYLFDSKNFFADKSWHEILFYSLFQSVTTRSGGLSTMDVSLLTEQNHLFMSFLMFIGASPSSAGGGIRTTTFALVVIFIITYARGGHSIRIFRREVYEEDLLKAVTVMLMAILTVFASVLIISSIEPYTITQILFEVTSAFGTVGLSLGITSELTTVSKVILMFLMFIGRVGIITFLFMFKKTKRSGNYHYPKERIIIG